MREEWVSFILHLSAANYRLKKTLLLNHAVKGFFIIISIILLETLLAIVSLPLYLVTKPEKIPQEGQKIYQIRRLLTLTLLIPLLGIWILQLGFILVAQHYSEPRFNLIPLLSSSSTSSDLPAVEAEISPVTPNFPAPTFSEITTLKPETFTISGYAPARKTIVARLRNLKGDQFEKIYDTTSSIEGYWSITHNPAITSLPSGYYQVQAFTYDSETHRKSAESITKYLYIKESLKNYLLKKINFITNLFFVLLLMFLFFLTVLTF